MIGYFFFSIIVLVLLFLFGPFPVRTYGVFVAVGYLTAILTAKKLCKKEGIEEDVVFDLALYILIGAVIGLRVLYFAFYDRAAFLRNPLSFFAIWNGGLVYYGGLIGGTVAAIIVLKKKKIDLLLPGSLFLSSFLLLAINRSGIHLLLKIIYTDN
jgi:phosphatidylglycerol:prolipoprotein diacylglycerol transferase